MLSNREMQNDIFEITKTKKNDTDMLNEIICLSLYFLIMFYILKKYTDFKNISKLITTCCKIF